MKNINNTEAMKMCFTNSKELNEQMSLGFQKLYAVAEKLSYGELEEMRKEMIFLTAAIANRQDKLRYEALSAKIKMGIL